MKQLLPANTIKIWDIHGGVHPPENKDQSLRLPIGTVSIAAEMVFPLNQHIGSPAVACVEVGQRVLAGQIIAMPKGPVSAAIHASTSGTISAIEERPLPHPSNLPGDCIVLTPDGLDEWIELTPCADYTQLDRNELLDKIRMAGIAGMGGAGFPAAIKLNPRGITSTHTPIDTLIINGTECEPYITADDILMQTRAADVVAGTQLLAHLLGNPAQIIIGIEDNKPEAITEIHEEAIAFNKEHGTRITVAHFPTKYPSGGEKQLIQILTGREVPSGSLPASIGVVVQNVGTTVAILEAIRDGKPLVSRLTTLVGEALTLQRNVQVRLGTPVSHLLHSQGFDEAKAARLIMGGPMMGFALETAEVPVIKTTNCIMAPSNNEIAEPTPAQACIRCGMCAEACPATLLPQQLYWYAQAQDLDRLQAHNIMDCIECGACSFVCPSNIPLVQYYRASKGAIRQAAIDKEKSDHSRRRFEFRQERINKAEAEKEAKRLARKQAADEAKQKFAADGAAASNTGATAATDVVATAIANIKNKPVSAEEQQAKLERALASAQSRYETAQTRLEEARADKDRPGKESTPEQLDKLAARLMQAEQKVKESQNHLDAFLAGANATGATATTDQAPADNDPVAAAIARAQAKMALPADEKLKANIESLRKRLTTAEEKLNAAITEGSATVAALQAGVEKLHSKIADAEQELASLTPSVATTVATTAPSASATASSAPAAEMDAAQAAITRAQAKAAAQASMSADDKLRDQIESLQKRLHKARERLAQAETENDDNIDAFRSGVEKLEHKLNEAKDQLTANT